jgi:hypothetical protein
MYPILTVDSELYRKLQEKEDQTPVKTGPRHRIVPALTCPVCGHYFFARRKNHKYCSESCRVMASNMRNGYIYQDGSYKKPKLKPTGVASDEIPILNSEEALKESISKLKQKITVAGIGESALGVLLLKY